MSQLDKSSRRPQQFAIVLLLAYLFSALQYGMTYRDWTFIDTCYFVMVSITTVGYGDLDFAKDRQHVLGALRVGSNWRARD